MESRRILLDRLKHSNEVNITVTGRRTKRKFSTPVWFVLDGEKVILVPMKGSDNEWYKDLVKEPQIVLRVDETLMPLRATLVRDSDMVEEILDKFRAKYGHMWSESYYIKRDVYVEVPI